MVKWALATVLAVVAGFGSAAHAQEAFVPGVVFDVGGKFDKSFNEAAYNGAERFKKETGIGFREFEIQNESQREQAMHSAGSSRSCMRAETRRARPST